MFPPWIADKTEATPRPPHRRPVSRPPTDTALRARRGLPAASMEPRRSRGIRRPDEEEP